MVLCLLVQLSHAPVLCSSISSLCFGVWAVPAYLPTQSCCQLLWTFKHYIWRQGYCSEPWQQLLDRFKSFLWRLNQLSLTLSESSSTFRLTILVQISELQYSSVWLKGRTISFCATCCLHRSPVPRHWLNWRLFSKSTLHWREWLLQSSSNFTAGSRQLEKVSYKADLRHLAAYCENIWTKQSETDLHAGWGVKWCRSICFWKQTSHWSGNWR